MRYEKTTQPHLQAGQFLEMWLLLQEEAAHFSECQRGEKGCGGGILRGDESIVASDKHEKHRNGAELCRGRATLEGKKKK